MHGLKNYRASILLVCGVLLGALCGIFFPGTAAFVKPVGDIFLNLLFVLVIPMVFFSISLSFFRLSSKKKLGETLFGAFCALAIIWLTSSITAYIGTLFINPLGDFDPSVAGQLTVQDNPEEESPLTRAFSVPDFPLLFSKLNLLPLIIFSAITGSGVALAGKKGEAAASLLDSGNEVTIKSMEILMKVAPLGLGCYFAHAIASIGSGLLGGYLKVFLLYCGIAAILFFIIYPLYVRLSIGKEAFKSFWKNLLPPTLTALATASSSVAMPGNIEAACRTGVDEDVSRSVVPLATNLLKGGSVAVDVLKTVFLMSLCSQPTTGVVPFLCIIGTAILAASVSGAVTNGGVTGEILICSLMGVKPEMVGIIMIIGTIVDIPATVVNSQTTVVAAAIADHLSRKRNK